MTLKPVTDRLWMLPGFANVFLLDAREGMTLIDTGLPGSETKIFAALQHLGRAPSDLRHIIITHGHFDHTGSLAALASTSGARVYVHAADVNVVERGIPFRPVGPRMPPVRALTALLSRPGIVTPARVDQSLADGETLPIGGGLRVIHAPGHSAGEIALVWPAMRVLFVGDVCMNMAGLRPPIAYEDRAAGERSQRRVAALDFDIACFGHGPPLMSGAAAALRKRFGTA